MAADGRRVERIVVAIGGEALAARALETAALLAKGLETPLAGLLVEDEQLLRLADLPSSLEMGFPSALLRPVDRTEIERSLRLRAETARRMLAEIAARLAVQWSLEVVRGDLLREALGRALPDDLVVVWRGARYGDAFFRARIHAVQPRPRRGPIALLVDEGEPDRGALSAAHALARELGSDVLTLVAAPAPEAATPPNPQESDTTSTVALVAREPAASDSEDRGMLRNTMVVIGLLIAAVVMASVLVMRRH